jgi:heat shock protein HslJ
MMRFYPLYLLLTLSVLLSACSDTSEDQSDESETPTVLTDVFINGDGVVGKWRLRSVETRDSGEQVVAGVAPYQVEFGEGGSIEGIADCNYFHGTYTTDDEGSLRIGQLDGSRAACELPSAWHRYLAVLQSALRYERMGERLVIHGTLAAQLVFEPMRQSD